MVATGGGQGQAPKDMLEAIESKVNEYIKMYQVADVADHNIVSHHAVKIRMRIRNERTKKRLAEQEHLLKTQREAKLNERMTRQIVYGVTKPVHRS